MLSVYFYSLYLLQSICTSIVYNTVNMVELKIYILCYEILKANFHFTYGKRIFTVNVVDIIYYRDSTTKWYVYNVEYRMHL